MHVFIDAKSRNAGHIALKEYQFLKSKSFHTDSRSCVYDTHYTVKLYFSDSLLLHGNHGCHTAYEGLMEILTAH